MSSQWTGDAQDHVMAWPPLLDDAQLLGALTDDGVVHAHCGTAAIVGALRRDLSVRARATVGVALLLREKQDTPLRALLGIAQDLLEPEEEEACENIVGILRDGWTQGVGELLAASRLL